MKSSIPTAINFNTIPADIITSRKWLKVSSLEKETVTFAQFNCLAKSLEDWFDVDEKFKSWEHRSPLILKEILQINPDVIGLEEVDQPEFFKENLYNHGFDGIFFYPEGKKIATALFWKIEKIKKLFSTEKNFQVGGGCIIAIMEISSRKKPFCVSVCHLKAKTPFETIRVKQVKDLFQEIHNFYIIEKGYGHEPIVMLGDFNSDPRNSFYNYIINGSVSHECVFYSSGTPMKSVYSEYPLTDPQDRRATLLQEPYTTVKTRDNKQVIHPIDYIFVNPACKVVEVYQIPDRKDLPDLGLPCENYGSDHLAIASKIYF